MSIRGPVLAVVETRDGGPARAGLEALAFARPLAAATGAELLAATLGGPGETAIEEVASLSGAKTIALTHPALSLYNADSFCAALEFLVSDMSPSYIVLAHTAEGWDYAPRLAARLDFGCVTAAAGFEAEPELVFLRPVCGGKLIARVAPLADAPTVVTVTPGSFSADELSNGEDMDGAARPGVKEHALPDSVFAGHHGGGDDTGERGARGVTAWRRPGARKTLDLGRAEVIVTAGRGIGKEENLELVKELAGLFDKSALGSTRPLVDLGWVPFDHQIGQTGQTVSPALYIACGVSGAIQHTSGMKGSGFKAAINKDPGAAIFDACDVGIVRDLQSFLPVLIEEIKAAVE